MAQIRGRTAEALAEMAERIKLDTSSPTTSIQRGQVSRLARLMEGLEGIAKHDDPTKTEAARIKQVSDAARRMESSLKAIQDESIRLYQSAHAEIEQSIIQRAGLRETPHSAEIRATLRSMSQQEKIELLRDAAARGDSDLIAAVTMAHPTASGVGLEFHGQLRESLIAVKAPELVEQRKIITENFEMTSVAIGAAREAIRAGINPERVAQIDQAVASNKAAEETFMSAAS